MIIKPEGKWKKISDCSPGNLLEVRVNAEYLKAICGETISNGFICIVILNWDSPQGLLNAGFSTLSPNDYCLEYQSELELDLSESNKKEKAGKSDYKNGQIVIGENGTYLIVKHGISKPGYSEFMFNLETFETTAVEYSGLVFSNWRASLIDKNWKSELLLASVNVE